MNRKAWRKFFRNKVSILALAVFLLIVGCCIFVPMLGFSDYYTLDVPNHHAPFTLEHPFGTDHLGRDLLSRMMIGGRYTLGLSFLATVLAIFFGVFFGILAGYKGGKTDSLIIRISEILTSIPYLLFVIIVEVFLGFGKGYFFLAVAIVSLPSVTRTIRNAVLKIRYSEYIEASITMGRSDDYILTHHVLRSILPVILLQITSTYASSIMACTILGYLDFGMAYPVPEWGRIVAEYYSKIYTHMSWCILPCVFIAASVLSVHLIGNGIRDVQDIREETE